MLFFRRFLYENGRLSALLEETPGEATGENGGAPGQGTDSASGRDGAEPAAGEQDSAEEKTEAGTEAKRIYKRFFRGAGDGSRTGDISPAPHCIRPGPPPLKQWTIRFSPRGRMH